MESKKENGNASVLERESKALGATFLGTEGKVSGLGKYMKIQSGWSGRLEPGEKARPAPRCPCPSQLLLSAL